MTSNLKRVLVYIAGPYRNEKECEVFTNIMEARRVAIALWKGGFIPICPHLNTFFFNGIVKSPKVFIDGDLEIVRRCDAMVMLDGWQYSEGAFEENELAHELGMPIFDLDGMGSYSAIQIMRKYFFKEGKWLDNLKTGYSLVSWSS